MRDRFFLDTNVLVYSFDATAPKKRQKALAMIEKALVDRSGIISWQVAQEFLNVATRKFAPAMTRSEAGIYLDTVLAPLCEVYPGAVLWREALAIREQTGYGFYDSLIIAAAIEGQCAVLYSEDMQDGRRIQNLTMKNPF